MITGHEEMTILKRVEALYCGLRDKAEIERRTFNPDKYKWVLGYEVLSELIGGGLLQPGLDDLFRSKSIFGIVVDVDRENPHTLRLWEDITDSVSIPYEEGAEE